MESSNSDPQEILFTVNRLGVDIMGDREEYKQLVYELYKEKPLLHRGKDSTNKELFKEEIRGYYKMIGHCLIVGDSDILYEFGIKPFEMQRESLVRPQNLDQYIEVFERRFKMNDIEEGFKFYLAMLIRAFKLANNEELVVPMINID